MGYYVTRQLEVRGGVGGGVREAQACSVTQTVNGILTCTEFNNSLTVLDPTITAGFVFNFSTEGQMTVPYVGADYAAIGVHSPGKITLVSSTRSFQEFVLNWTNNIRPTGGVKFFVRRNIAFDINVGWDKDLGENASDLNTFDMRVGFSYVF
jgi:hypothetical protein